MKVNTKRNMQVPFEVLVRRQIARLLDPSLQCARFIYDELIKVHLASKFLVLFGSFIFASGH